MMFLFSLATCFSGIKREREKEKHVWEEEKEEVCGRTLLVQLEEVKLVQTAISKTRTQIIIIKTFWLMKKILYSLHLKINIIIF